MSLFSLFAILLSGFIFLLSILLSTLLLRLLLLLSLLDIFTLLLFSFNIFSLFKVFPLCFLLSIFSLIIPWLRVLTSIELFLLKFKSVNSLVYLILESLKVVLIKLLANLLSLFSPSFFSFESFTFDSCSFIILFDSSISSKKTNFITLFITFNNLLLIIFIFIIFIK